jgi:hypothetical protein
MITQSRGIEMEQKLSQEEVEEIEAQLSQALAEIEAQNL